jgi:NAD dependent epimerase/dehydratase
VKILLTGAGGFIGSHLLELLVKDGNEIRAFVHYNSLNQWGWIDQLPDDIMKSIDVFAGDIRDPNGVRSAMNGCSHVLHLAALIGIPFSYHSPDIYLDTNIRGTLNVLQAARDLNVERVIHTSTSEIYGTAQFVPITESHPINPQSPYAATKAAADFLALTFWRSFSLPVVVIRPFNTYGPRQSARAIIPTIITQVLAGKEELILGSLAPSRDLTFVHDTAMGFYKALSGEGMLGEVINLGTMSGITIGDLALKIASLAGKKIRIISKEERIRPEKSEVERLLADNSKAALLLGWKPSYGVDKGLTETIDWFREPRNMDRYKSDIYNI